MEKNNFYQKVYLAASKIAFGKEATFSKITDLIYE
tara:strand:+ start:66 stop:170 length:105 start_codon:yes stop_codon:yes gene_type:complete